MSPYEEAKSYTHQVVVVAPITGKISILCDYKRYITAPVPKASFWDHLCFICPSQPFASLASSMTRGQWFLINRGQVRVGEALEVQRESSAIFGRGSKRMGANS